MSDDFLGLELRLLILRYGKAKVLGALAQLDEQSPAEAEQQSAAAEVGTPRRPKRPTPSAIDVAAAEGREHPEIAGALETLAVGFQKRTFLPHLRDVQRFLDRRGLAGRRLRSREGAAQVLFRALTMVPQDELLRLAEQVKSGESDYALLARAIMGRRPAQVREGDQPQDEATLD